MLYLSSFKKQFSIYDITLVVLGELGGGGHSCSCKAPRNRKPLAEVVICHGITHRVNNEGICKLKM